MGVYKIQVVKGGDLIEVDTSKISEENYEKVILMGLKHFVNATMTKITKVALPDDDVRHKAAMEVAAENVEKMYTGNLRMVGAKAAKAKTGSKDAVHTLAMQEAKMVVKAEIKRQKVKISHVDPKQITEWAEAILADKEQGGPILERARLAVEASKADIPLGKMGIVINISEKHAKLAEGRKTRAKEARQAKRAATSEAEEATEVEAPSGLSGVPAAHVIAASKAPPTRPGFSPRR